MTIAVFTNDELYLLQKIWENLSEKSNLLVGIVGIRKPIFLKYIPIHGLLGERFYSLFDKQNCGYISLDNFIHGLSILCLGTIVEQSIFLFPIFDIHKNGYIKKNDLFTLLKYIPLNVFCNCCRHCCCCDISTNKEYFQLHDFHKWVINTPALIGYFKEIIPCSVEDDCENFDKLILWKKGEHTKMMFKIFYLIKGNCLYLYDKKKNIRPKKVIFLLESLIEINTNADMEAKGYFEFSIYQKNQDKKKIFYCQTTHHRQLLIDNLQHIAHIIPIQNEYTINEQIGKGAFSTIHQCEHHASKEIYAVKIINKNLFQNKLYEEQLQNEISILKLLNHPNIIHIKDNYEDTIHIYIVVELIKNGDFFDYIIGRNCFQEHELKNIMKQLFEALAYIHEFGIVHCDVKPENILYDISTKKIVLTDFGLSKMILSNQKIDNVMSGTLQYIAPEILSGIGFGIESDMWSAGIIMYLLANGKLPYEEDTVENMLISILQKELDIHANHLSNNANELIVGLLEIDANKRITAKHASLHPFFII
jgi:tRNA A-37 threonylcarbamoyl transferase component Bud32